MPQTRQLAAIMFTDIVGYTALMGNDEQKAFELLNKNREIQKPIIEEFNGRWIKELGDGVMASFITVSDAVNAAIKIQQTCNAEKEFLLRIGIHLGEVVFENDDVFGDGVNIAARIQAAAKPGCIYISESVYNNVSNKKDINTKFVGEENLKNVKELVRIYEVIIENNHPVMQLLSNDNSSGNPIPEKSIAVLPFVNRSSDPEQEYFSDGLSEELLNLLAKITELKVIGRTSSFSFKGKKEDLRSIAQKLGVSYILEGSVRKDRNRIRITAQLIKATDGSHLWSETYDRDLEDIFKLQDEIAGAVVEELKLKLLSVADQAASHLINTEVYNLILQGNYYAEKRDEVNLAKALDFYSQALAIDSLNARSWAAVAKCYVLQADWGWIDRNEGFKKAEIAAKKAIALDEKQADGYIVLGIIKMNQFDWDEAETDLMKALNLIPGNADLLRLIGYFYVFLGRFDEAILLTKKSIVLDPIKSITYFNYGYLLYCANQPEEAIAAYKKTLELNPQFPRTHYLLAKVYLLQGKPELALEEMSKEKENVCKIPGLSLSYHSLGRRKEADETMQDFILQYQNESPYLIAELYAFRGEKDIAFEWLEKAFIQKDTWLTWLKADPLLQTLWTDSRYQTLLKKMNLPGVA